jgi:protein-L-isoaspartate(D-aspartate) O-methyltransferase
MVEAQLRARGIRDERVLAAMGHLPRHEFVPAEQAARAYDDGPLAIGLNQTISQPYIVALMTEKLNPGQDDRVLEIGTGSGYQTAILAKLAGAVFTVEVLREHHEVASELLRRLGYTNIRTRLGDGNSGWPLHAPFDGIIVTAAARELPERLLGQLKEGGRMIVPVDDERGGGQRLRLVRRRRGLAVDIEEGVPVRFVPLVQEAERE